MADRLTHIGEDGRARMVDVSDKPSTHRVAKAAGKVTMSAKALELALNQGGKGDVRSTAEIAGVMGAKRTSDLIPMCHPLALSKVRVRVEPAEDGTGMEVEAEAITTGPTGVEMEALSAVSIACLTIYDMAKALDKSMTIGGVELVEKSGGASGDFRR